MSKEQAVIHYRTAMAVFSKWLAEGIITEAELINMDDLSKE